MVKRYEPSDGDSPALTLLAKQVDGLAIDVKQLGELRNDVEAHTRTLGRLGRVLDELVEQVRGLHIAAMPRHEAGAPTEELDDEGEQRQDPSSATSGALVDPASNWITVTDVALAVRWLDDLSVWVARVWTRYGPLTECWPWHAHVVAELLVCRHQWLDATADGVGADLLAAWHDRWRPGVHHRVTKYLAACERTDGLHVGLRSTRWTYDVAFLEPLAQWWATTHGRDPRTPPPGLTQDHSR